MTDAPSQSAGANRQALLATVAVAVAILCSIAVAATLPLPPSVEFRIYDFCVRMRGRVPAELARPRTPAPITIVWIDAETASFLAKPRMLWPAEFGEVLRAASSGGAKVVGLDASFDYPVTRWDDAADPLFFQAYVETTQRGIPVILAHDGLKSNNSDDLLPVYKQAAADGNLASAKIADGDDPVVRNMDLSGQPFCVRVANAFTGRHALGIEGSLPIWYYGRRHSVFQGAHMSEVLKSARAGDDSKLRTWFQGRIVLIGTDGLEDRHATPLDRTDEGVEIQANAISTIVQGDVLRAASDQEKWALLAIAAVVAALLAYFIGWPYALISALLLIATLFAGAVVMNARGMMLPVAPAALAIAIASITAALVRSLISERRRQLLQESFAGRVSEQALDAVIEYQPMEVNGESRVVTVMFCNVIDFTLYSAGRNPQDLIRELNEFLGEMSGCVIRNGGMVNKYFGDGLMALFGAPVNYPDHAHRAVVCALEMQTRLDLLNERRTRSGMEPWQMGVGIHTGDVVLGMMGAPDKLEYSATGGAINIAARLESLNKKFGTQILLSVSTRDAMGFDIATTWKGTYGASAGREEENVYTV